MTKVKFKAIHPDFKVPTQATKGSAGFDLVYHGIEKIPLWWVGTSVKIPLGFSVEIPKGFEGQLRARSGLAAKHGIILTNGVGTIDSDFSGEVCVLLTKISNTLDGLWINPGDRVCQMVICPVLTDVEFELVDELTATERGEGGFGSTAGFGEQK